MGYKLFAQLALIVAALVLLFAFVQPALGTIKVKQDELFEYNDAIEKVKQFNARLQELISIRDSFSGDDIQALEKFVPTQIDQLKVMSEIAGIFSSRNVPITLFTAGELVNPASDILLEHGILENGESYSNVTYQDFEVTFTGTYDQLREILMLTEASDSLLEVMELNFSTSVANEISEEGNPAEQTPSGEHSYKIVFRTYGLPIDISI
jgi:hypothetical protein